MKKNTQKKTDLKSSILLLLLMAILLIASTYAWFTANQTVTVNSLNVNVVAQNGLQISNDGTTWKAVLANEDITPGAGSTLDTLYASNKNQIPTVLQPVSTDGTVAGGKMNMFFGAVDADPNQESPTYGEYMLTTTALSESQGAGESAGDFIAFDMFLKVDADTDLVLTKDSDVTADGEDKGLKNSARVAFVTSESVDSSSALSDIQGLVPKTNHIWEPNSDVHTGTALNHVKSYYSSLYPSLSANSKLTNYYGVKAPTTTPVVLDSVDESVFGIVTPDYQTSETNADDTDVFSLKAGITKVRVYMWVEGQDIDCENTASGTDINFDIQLQVKS